MPRKSVFTLVLLTLAAAAAAQDRRDWQSLSQLKPGDTILLTLKSGPVKAEFHRFTPRQVTAGTVTANKEDVLKIVRYREGGSRGKSIGIGALIGFGAGFAVGAGTGGDCKGEFGPCISQGALGAILGGAGALIGGAVGAILPHRTKELIYSAN